MGNTISSNPSSTDPELPFGGGTPTSGSSSGEPEVVVIKGPPRPSNYTSPLESEQKEKNEMNGSTPAALNVKRSIDRQRKEQRAAFFAATSPCWIARCTTSYGPHTSPAANTYYHQS